MAKNVFIEKISEPLNGAKTAKIDIHAGDGNLTIDRLTGSEHELVSGTLEYFEKQGLPNRNLVSSNGQANLTLRGASAGRPWFHFPWSACNGATEWQIHLNPTVSSDIKAQTSGGNVKLNLGGMAVSGVSAGTGGGNLDVFLPENAAGLSVDARTGGGNVHVDIGSGITGSNVVNATSGAGNVSVSIPSGLAGRIYASTGLGKVFVDPWFSRIDNNTYQSIDFESAPNKVEITVKSGAGNVSVITR